MSTDLVLLTDATRMLAEAQTLPDIQRVANLAKRAADYAKAAKLGLDAQNSAATICREAEAKAGELLIQMREQGERRSPGRSYGRRGARMDPLAPSALAGPTLPELGIRGPDATRWQAVASIPAEQRAAYYAEAQEAGEEITRQGLLRSAGVVGDTRKRKPAIDPEDPSTFTPHYWRSLTSEQRREATRKQLRPTGPYPRDGLLPRVREAAWELGQYDPARTAERLTGDDIAWLQQLRDYVERVLVAAQKEAIS